MKKLIRTLLVTLAVVVCLNTAVLNWQMLSVENRQNWTEFRVDADERSILAVSEYAVGPTAEKIQENLRSAVKIEVYTGRFNLVTMQPERTFGTGVITNSTGVILTVKHVVEGLSNPKACGTVSLQDGTVFQIQKYVVADPNIDLALVKIDPNGRDLTTTRFGVMPRVGDLVWTIGNPGGFSFVLSQGVVSKILPPMREDGDSIMTDCAMNPGNSGGPSFDRRGDLIGIAQGFASPGQFNVGINFLVGIDVVTDHYCRMYRELSK